VVSTTGPSHYAVKLLRASTALWAACEDQSRRVDKANYGRQDARSVNAGNQSLDSTRQIDEGRNRWVRVRVA